MNKTRKLIECALLIAIATVLSLIKLVDLPYGGSITAASMVPMVIIAYRHGLGWGIGSGVVYGIIQQLTGLNTLSYATTWMAVVAIILLDYVVAFAVTGLGGIFKGRLNGGGLEVAIGCFIVCFLRYLCHVLSGATVWAGISIPTAAALSYSFVYNATYMIPEMIATVVAGYYIASTVDFDKNMPVRKNAQKGSAYSLLSGLFIVVLVIFDTVALFSVLQNEKTGEFAISNIASAPWTLMAIITAVCLISAIVLRIISTKKQK